MKPTRNGSDIVIHARRVMLPKSFEDFKWAIGINGTDEERYLKAKSYLEYWAKR